jgi:DNA helicase-2/ATP-dependent DNA helicase PcrA
VPGAADVAAAGVQLAAYRLGWARLTGVPVERVSAGFHHVAAGVTLRPVDLLDEAGLLALVSGVG